VGRSGMLLLYGSKDGASAGRLGAGGVVIAERLGCRWRVLVRSCGSQPSDGPVQAQHATQAKLTAAASGLKSAVTFRAADPHSAAVAAADGWCSLAVM
jgi:hypothetical protein